MKSIIKPVSSILAGITLVLSLAACGSDGGSSASTTKVSGTVFAGPAAGSSVIVKDGSGNVIAGPVTTTADGSYAIAVPNANLAADLIFEASGGSYTDEATAAAGVPLGTLSAHAHGGSLAAGSIVTIDPSSTIMQKLIAGGKSRAAAETDYRTAFGYTPDCTIKPSFANTSSVSTTAERLAGLRNAAFSQLTKDMGIPAARQHELINALAEDLADGVLDGKKSAAALSVNSTPLPEDMTNRFATALMDFQQSANNRSGLKPDQIGVPPFATNALTATYGVEYIPGTAAAAMGKTTFTIKLTNRADGTPAAGKAVTIRPYMYMSTKSHSTPKEAVVDNGNGTYSCTVYYVMTTMMNNVSMGVWELKVTIDGSESVRFYPVVGMPMGGTTALTKLLGVNDAITGMAGQEKRTWFLFNNGLQAGQTAGQYDFRIFLATKEMTATRMLTFPAVKSGDVLLDALAASWTVNNIVIEASTDKATWIPATDSGNGHWTVAGLTDAAAGKIYVRLSVNGESKTTDGTASTGLNDFQTYSVTP